jgi:hypothetical protein
MRKISLGLILVLCFVSLLYAAPCYGPNLPGKNKLSAELESYTIFKRHLENDLGKLKSQQQFFGLSYGVFDWLAIDLKAGAGNLKQYPSGASHIDYGTNFAGGYGLRVKFFDRDKIKAVFGFQHISVHPDPARSGAVKHKAILDDWQVSLLGSYAFGKVTPYLGTRWSRLDYIHWTGDKRKRVMSDPDECVGLITGINIPITERFWINLEGQFLDSEAVACRLNFDF